MLPELHPLAEKYPLMEAEEFVAFKADLDAHGQKNPIWLFEGKVLDGRNRLRACVELSLEPVFAEFAGTEAEAEAFVDSQNLHRRHLSREWRQKRVREMRAEGKSCRVIANELGISYQTAHRDANAVASDTQNASALHEPVSVVTNVTTETSHPEPSSGVENATPEPSKPSTVTREPPRVIGTDGKSYRAQKPVVSKQKPTRPATSSQTAGTKPKPAPPAKAQWTELASILSELAQKVENLVPTPEENDRPWELIKSLETTAASLLRQAERLRRRHHL
jgi:hypothetical protein